MCKKIAVLIISAALLFTFGCSKQPDEEILSVQKLWDELLSSAILEDEAYVSDELMNAIYKSTTVKVIEVSNGSCKVKITYPDAGSALSSKANELPNDFMQEHVDEMYRSIIAGIEQKSLKMAEGVYTAGIMTDENSKVRLSLSADIINALTGGLSSLSQ